MKLIFFRKLLIGALLGAATSLVLLLIFTAVLSSQDDPSKLMGAFSIVSLVAGAIVCGKAATIGLENKALQGLFAGLIFTVIILLPSVLLSSFDSLSFLKMLLCIVLAFAGAMIGRKNGNSIGSARRRKNVMKRYAR